MTDAIVIEGGCEILLHGAIGDPPYEWPTFHERVITSSNCIPTSTHRGFGYVEVPAPPDRREGYYGQPGYRHWVRMACEDAVKGTRPTCLDRHDRRQRSGAAELRPKAVHSLLVVKAPDLEWGLEERSDVVVERAGRPVAVLKNACIQEGGK